MSDGIIERSSSSFITQRRILMKNGTIVVLAVVLSVTAGVAVTGKSSGTNSAKQTSQSATHTRVNWTVHHRMGTVDSVTANELILDHRWKGKEEKTRFTLNSDTRKETNVEKGDHVTVYYHLEKGHRIATDLKASGTKPKTETKKT
jgi:hypothetical protein